VMFMVGNTQTRSDLADGVRNHGDGHSYAKGHKSARNERRDYGERQRQFCGIDK